MGNHTRVTVFILAGLTDDPQWKVVLFIFLLLIYILSITGNLIIITLTLLDIHLKSPMYFFLRNFSFLEISYTSTCIPKFLLTVATGVIMKNKICTQLVLSCWLAGFFVIFPPIILGQDLDFCASNIIEHFYCDTTPLMQISCTDTRTLELMGFISALVTLLITLIMVIISYTFIALTILKFPSTSQRKKAFSTCSSHMIVISLSYGSCIFMYVNPSVKQKVSFSKGISVLNTSVTPLLNPFIYTLRNQQVKKGFMVMVHRLIFFSKK
ncbi:PREDICTED: LOW QUALITY PROTEIN: olfactory receptor 6C75-like [Myotis davidii]|uniref:LOW QUALITY PROTEIN: olfactory receptor 6C75-like n=1 Tax=Myotis davidii TaxID=225400 RepID=UPI0007677619|nr:PREDICTED: LOW QUALITY PROTEIN: olfactory receptor 6C75-like [Myotis davidii]